MQKCWTFEVKISQRVFQINLYLSIKIKMIKTVEKHSNLREQQFLDNFITFLILKFIMKKYYSGINYG